MYRYKNNKNQWIYSETKDIDKDCYHSTLTESTGIKDINGQEIYEGDIVSNGSVNGGVIFKNGKPMIEIFIFKKCDDNCFLTMEISMELIELTEGFEIVGDMTKEFKR